MMTSEQRNVAIGAAFAAGAILCFSIRPILIKIAYGYMSDPVTLLALRMGFALPFFLWPAIAIAKRRRQTPIGGRDAVGIVILGFFGYYLGSYFDFLGLQYISAGLGRLILFLYPTIVVALSVLFLGKRATGRELVALAVTYTGLALALSPAFSTDNKNFWLGAGFIFAGAFVYSIYLVGGTQIVRRTGSLRFSAYATSLACGLCVAQFLVLRPLSALDLPWIVYGLSLVIATLCTAIPVFMTAEALKRIGANRVAMIGALGPVSTIFWGWAGLDEAMSLIQLGGVGLVLGGVLMVSLRPVQ